MILRRLLIANLWMILFYILIIAIPLNAERPTIIDTIYTENTLQGGLGYHTTADLYIGGVFPPSTSLIFVGDSFDDWYYNDSIAARAYFSFQIQTIPSNYQIDSVLIYIYQYDSTNNNIGGIFPFWDTIPPEYQSCNLYHVNYGMSLGIEDFDPQIFSLVGAISTDNLNGWKILNITSAYLQDLNQGRPYNQIMLKFRILTDFDYSMDGIDFGTTYSEFSPHANIYYSLTTINSDDIVPHLDLLEIYPNPVYLNGSKGGYTFIEFTLPEKAKEQPVIDIYNLKGQKVRTIRLSQSYNDLVRKAGLQSISQSFAGGNLELKQETISQTPKDLDSSLCWNDRKGGEFYSTVWDCKDDRNQRLASGIYIVKVRSGSKQAAIKMTLLK